MATTILGLNGNTKKVAPQERAGMVLLNLSDAREAAAERAQADKDAKMVKVTEAIGPAIFSLTSGDGEDAKFRRLTSPQTLRDLNPLMHDRMQQVCFFLAVTTPFGKRIVEIITSYVVGNEFKVVCEDPAAQDIVDRFWNDDINNMDERCQAICSELTTFGEFCCPVNVNPVDGFVRLGYVDPMQIDTIEYGKMETAGGDQEVSFPVNVRLRREVGVPNPKRLSIVRMDEDIHSDTYGFLNGETFYFAINKAMSASRGISELFSLADWIDVFDQMIFDFADKVRFLNSYVWQYTLEGANKPEVDKFQKDITQSPPRQGGVFVSNEKVKIEAKTPDFKGQDMAAGAEMVKNYGLGGAGLPDFFFGDSDSGNRSIGEAMEGPTGKKLGIRQNHQVSCIKRMVLFVLQQAKLHGALGKNVNAKFTVETPDLIERDITKSANALSSATQALEAGEDRGWIQGETAARAFHMLVGQIGTVIEDSKAEYEAAQQQLQDKKAQQQNDLFPQDAMSKALAAAAAARGGEPIPAEPTVN